MPAVHHVKGHNLECTRACRLRIAQRRPHSLPSAPSCIHSDHISMAQPAVSPPAISPTKPDAFPAAGRTAPATNGHYLNGSATASDASSERMQVINDEKEFRCGPCVKIWNTAVR